MSEPRSNSSGGIDESRLVSNNRQRRGKIPPGNTPQKYPASLERRRRQLRPVDAASICYTRHVRIDPDLVTDSDIRAALGAEMASARRDLPPDSIYPALVGREEAVAKWIHERHGRAFAPTSEETVGVNKGRHGVRPVAVWDLTSRLTYRALTAKLEPHLPPLLRNRAHWHCNRNTRNN